MQYQAVTTLSFYSSYALKIQWLSLSVLSESAEKRLGDYSQDKILLSEFQAESRLLQWVLWLQH